LARPPGEPSTDSPRPDSPRPKRTTLSDVAHHAGVSAVTVSRALRKPDMVSLDLRRRIDTAVRDLAYIPNQLASALASSRTHTIGVVVPSLTNGVFADYLRSVHDVLIPADFRVVVFNTRYSAIEEEKAIESLLGQHPEAMIVAGIDQTPRSRLMLEQAGIPVVQTMELTDDPIDINIGLSQRDGGYAATRYLIDLGHVAIAQISARLDPRSRRRIDGYKAAMDEASLGIDQLISATVEPSTVNLGADLFRELRARNPRMSAVFCCNDDLALGALFACQRGGIDVPRDISIVGFNDLEFCSTSFPTLTSVATPRYEMARRAAEIVLEIIRGGGQRPASRRIDLGFSIRERESTAPLQVPSGARPRLLAASSEPG
jgi:LacI family gluconate utilization system Gnt-I transcriptional repressor